MSVLIASDWQSICVSMRNHMIYRQDQHLNGVEAVHTPSPAAEGPRPMAFRQDADIRNLCFSCLPVLRRTFAAQNIVLNAPGQQLALTCVQCVMQGPAGSTGCAAAASHGVCGAGTGHRPGRPTQVVGDGAHLAGLAEHVPAASRTAAFGDTGGCSSVVAQRRRHCKGSERRQTVAGCMAQL